MPAQASAKAQAAPRTALVAAIPILRAFADDWEGLRVPLALGLIIVFGFSQGWECPIFGYGTTQSAADSGFIRLAYYPAYACGIGLAAAAWRRLLGATWRTPLLLTLILMCLVSMVWSIDPATTLRRFVAMFMTSACAYALAARFSWRRLVEILALTFTFLALASIVMVVVFPDKGKMIELFPGAWRGVYDEKNSLGAVMAIGFVSAVAAALHNPSRWRGWTGAAAMMAGLVLMSTSKTALLSLLIGLSVIGALWVARRGPVLAVLVSWGVASSLVGLAGIILTAPTLLFSLLGKDATLTGRTFIWDGIMRQIQTRPDTGFGYGVVWTIEDRWAPLAKIVAVAGFRPYHAHSSWLEVWLALGIGGLILWGLVFAETWLKALWRAVTGDGGYFALPFLAMFSIESLTESMTLAWNDLRWCLVVLVLVKLSLKGDADGDAKAPAGGKRAHIRPTI
jgi:O-antigen ligase